MGGKLFKTERFDRNTYDQVLSCFTKALSELGVSITDIPFFRTKDSFGDIDVITTSEEINHIVCEDKLWSDVVLEKLKEYDPQCRIATGQGSGIRSFKFMDTQVDLIYVPKRAYQRTYDMLSWNDLSGFVGILMRSVGMKLSNKDGIGIYLDRNTTYDFNNNEVMYIQNASLSDALQLVGLSVEQFNNGFDTKEEIFDYVTSSPLYEYGMFSYENGNNKHRQRNKERGTFKEMLEYCETNKDNKQIVREPVSCNEMVIKFGEIIGIPDLLDVVYKAAYEAYVRQEQVRIISEARNKAIYDTLDLLYPEVVERSDQKKLLGQFYQKGILNSSLSMEEICDKIIQYKLTERKVND